MNLPQIDKGHFLQLAAALMGLASALLILRGGFFVSPDSLAALASANWDYNLAALESLADQAADTRIGVALIIVGTTLQLWALGARSSGASAVATRNAKICAVTLFASAVIIGTILAEHWSNEIVDRTQEILDARIDRQKSAAEPGA